MRPYEGRVTGAAARLRAARRQCGFMTASAAAKAFGWSFNTYAANENGNAPFSAQVARRYAEAFGVAWRWLSDGHGPMRSLLGPDGAGLIGSVGRNPDCKVSWWDAAEAAADPGLLVEGDGVRPFAAAGGLIYFAAAHRAPVSDLVGRVSIIGLEGDAAVLGRLRRGCLRTFAERLSDGMVLPEVVRWASPVTVVAPPTRTPSARTTSAS